MVTKMQNDLCFEHYGAGIKLWSYPGDKDKELKSKVAELNQRLPIEDIDIY